METPMWIMNTVNQNTAKAHVSTMTRTAMPMKLKTYDAMTFFEGDGLLLDILINLVILINLAIYILVDSR
jgi:hypothetical protein